MRPSAKPSAVAKTVMKHEIKPKVAQAPLATKVSDSAVLATPSVHRGKIAEVKEVAEDYIPIEDQGTRNQTFTLPTLQAAWKEYFDALPSGSLKTLGGTPLEILSDQDGIPIIKLRLANATLVDYFKSDQGNVKGFLKDKLQNDVFRFDYATGREEGGEEKVSAFSTPTTIYKSMVKKNPILDELKRQLKLRVD